MALTRYQPLALIREFQSDLSNLLERNRFPFYSNDLSNVVTSDWTPQIDIEEKADCFSIYADVPGVEPEKIEISMENNVLTIQGERNTLKEEVKDNFSRIERSSGKFYRCFTLPESANTEQITAKGQHGVLEITIPKKELKQSKKIEIKVEK